MPPEWAKSALKSIRNTYRSFTNLQRTVFIGLSLLFWCTIFGCRFPFFSYFIIVIVTYLLCTKALCQDSYADSFREFLRKRQDELYDLLDDHPSELRQYTFYRWNEQFHAEVASISENSAKTELSTAINENGAVIDDLQDHIPEYKVESAKIVQHIFKDFVLSWYLTISDELTFAQNVHVVLDELVIAVDDLLRTVDRFEFSKEIIKMYTSHLADYQSNIAVLKTQPKYRKNNMTFTKLNSVVEVYEKQRQFHPALESDEQELNHIRGILCAALRKLVAPDRLTSVVGIDLVIEILSRSVLQPLIALLSEPDVIYELLIKILADDDESILQEIQNHHKNFSNGDVKHESHDERVNTDISLSHFVDVVEALTAKSHHFLKHFNEERSGENSPTSPTMSHRLRTMSVPFEDITVHSFRKASIASNYSLHSSVEIVNTDDDLDPVDYELLKVRTESNVSDYLMIVPNDDNDIDVLQSNLGTGQCRLRRALTEERRSHPLTRRLSLPTLDEVGSIKLDDDLSQPSSPIDVNNHDDIPDDLIQNDVPEDMVHNDVHYDLLDSISVSSGDYVSDEGKNSTLRGSSSSLDSRPPDLTLLHESLASLPDVTSSTSLFENLYVTGTEAMQEYGSPENHYVCYVIQYDGWYYSGAGLTKVPRVVRRRFREFVTLQDRLNENPVCRGLLKGIRGPNRWWTLPFNKLDYKTVEKRKLFLEQYLQTLIKKQPLAVSQEMKEFLAYDSDASLAFVRKAQDMPVQWLDKVLLKPVSGVFDKLTTALPSFPTSLDATVIKSDSIASRRSPSRIESDYAHILPDKDDDALNLEYMIVADSEKFTISRLPSLMMSYLHNMDDHINSGIVSDDADSDDFYDAVDTPVLARRSSSPSCVRNHPMASLLQKMPLACSVMDLGAQLTLDLRLKFYNEQVLGVFYVLIGWYFDRFLRSEIVDISSPAMIARYLFLLRTTLWPEEEVVECPKTPEQLQKTREWAGKCLLDFFPWFIPVVVGSGNLAQSVELVMASLEHPKLNRHLVLTALDLIVENLIPDISVTDDVIRQPNSEYRASRK